jgi:hypothetical protein
MIALPFTYHCINGLRHLVRREGGCLWCGLEIFLSLLHSPTPTPCIPPTPTVLGHRSRVHYGVHIQSWLCSFCYCHPFSSGTGILHTIQINRTVSSTIGLWNGIWTMSTYT